MKRRVGIVGAGPAGLMAGRTLAEHGWPVTLIDKGRRPGGRANTREHGPHRFDHGAQYFTVRDRRVQPHVGSWLEAGVVGEWTGALVRIRGEEREPATRVTRFVGVPGMIRLAQHLAEGLDVRAGVRIQRLQGVGDVWVAIDTEGAAHGPFDVVIVAVPAPQAVPLLAPAPALAEVASGITMAPCWAAMVAFDEPVVAGFDGAFVSGGALSWVARDSSKPGRPDGERWVLHASPGWSRQEWETDLDRIPSLLCSALASHIGPVPAPTFQRAHRWGYARADAAGAPGVMYDAAAGIGACGDWCEGGRIEGALVSGIDLAERIIAGGG